MDAIFQYRRMKVDQQSDSASRKPEICEHHRLVDRGNGRYSFDFDDNFFRNDEIGAITAIKFDCFVHNRDGFLSREWDATID